MTTIITHNICGHPGWKIENFEFKSLIFHPRKVSATAHALQNLDHIVQQFRDFNRKILNSRNCFHKIDKLFNAKIVA